MIVGFMGVKLFLLVCLVKCLRLETRKHFGIKIEPTKVIISQIVSLSRFMIISALKNILDFSFCSIKEKMNVLGHVITLFCCLFVVVVSHINNTSTSSKKTRELRNRRRRNKETCDYAFYIIMPFAVAFQNVIVFLSTAMALSCLRAIIFKKAFWEVDYLERIYGILIHSIWITYVSIFIILKALEKVFFEYPFY